MAVEAMQKMESPPSPVQFLPVVNDENVVIGIVTLHGLVSAGLWFLQSSAASLRSTIYYIYYWAVNTQTLSIILELYASFIFSLEIHKFKS